MSDLYELSDDELVNLDMTTLEPSNQEQETVNEEQPEQEQEQVAEQVSEDNTDNEEVVSSEEELPAQDGEAQASEPATGEVEDTTDELDYQGFYTTLTTPFKANGREVQVTDPKDMIALMQKGFNYSKKMEELKPKMNLVKTLEQYGLADEAKLSFLIDVHNKSPEAIAKLVKEAGIDLYEFDVNQSDHYVPNNKVVNSSPIEEMVGELTRQDPNFSEFMDEVYHAWDMQSKEALIENPELLNIFHAQKQAGFYDEVMGIYEYEKALGRLTNVPFLQAYSQIETQLMSQKTAQQQTQQQVFTAPRPKDTAKQAQGNKLKAASPSTNTATNQVPSQADVLSMSDEELVAYLANLS